MKLYAISVSASFPNRPADSSRPHASLDQLVQLVDHNSQRKIRSYRLLDDAHRCLLGRLLRQYITARALGTPPTQLTFGQTDRGRPFIATPPAAEFDFNIAHDGDWVLMACVDDAMEGRRVGVDVMTLRNPWEGETVETFASGINEQLSLAEQQWLYTPGLPSTALLTRALTLWTLKEAYVKATGLGLHFDLARISFGVRKELREGAWTEIGAQVDGAALTGWRFGVREWRGCVVAWAVEGGEWGDGGCKIEVIKLKRLVDAATSPEG